jgi:catechol 2,3-dioxygenase-like lactoylglutathione lyase family enzyme
MEESLVTTTPRQAAIRELSGDPAQISPVKLAHVVFRTSRYAEIVAWYKTVLNAKAAFANDVLTFLSYDDEHHRVAVINMPDLGARATTAAGLHHVAFTFRTLADLITTYVRLRDLGIKPVFVINHGPTTSLYYEDPDGNNIEFQIDNFESIEDATAFFYSPAFAENPVGVEFDPEVLLARFRSGEPEADLKRRPSSGPKGLSDIKLR